MEGHHGAVASHVGIGLQVAVPERDGPAEGLERVLGRLLRATPVGDGDRCGRFEEGMRSYLSRGRGSTSLSLSQSRSASMNLGSIVWAIAASR